MQTRALPQVITQEDLLTGHSSYAPGYVVRRSGGTTDWLLMLTLGGACHVQHASGVLCGAPGTVVLYAPHVAQQYGTAPDADKWELLWVHFHPRAAWHEWLRWPACAPGVMLLKLEPGETFEQIAACLATMHARATGALAQRTQFAMNALEEALLWCDTVNPENEQTALDPRIRQAMDFMCRSLRDPVGVEHAAQACHLSVSRFAHLFREQVGQTPQQFLEAQRMARARQLLERTSLSVAQIAHEVGFENPFYFSERFRRYAGKSPRAYRNCFMI